MMTVLFWGCWVIDLLLCAIAIVGKVFTDSFHQSSSVPWLAVLIVGGTVTGLLFQVFFKKPSYALMAAALPQVAMLGLYVYEKIMGV